MVFAEEFNKLMKKESLVNPFKDGYPKYLSFSMTILLLALTFFLSMGIALQNQNIRQKSEKLEQEIINKLDNNKSKNTTGWKTYYSPGFSFDYPNNWQDPIEELISTDQMIAIKDGEETQYSTAKLDITDRAYYNQEIQTDLTFEELVDDYLTSYLLPYVKYTKENITIDNWNGYRITYLAEDKYTSTDIYISESASSTRIIKIHYRHDDTEQTDRNPLILDQILSSFTFLSDTSNWKIYTDTKSGFLLKYPDSYFKYQQNTKLGFLVATSNPKGGNSPKFFGHDDVWLTAGTEPSNTESLDQYIKSNSQYTSAQKTPVNIDGKNGYKMTYTFLAGPADPLNPTYIYEIVTIKDNKIYLVEMSSWSQKSLENYKNTFDQILSTFEFTK